MHLEIDIEKIEDLMARDRLTYKTLAEAMKIHRNTLLNIKNNPDHFTGRQVSTLSKIFNVSGKELLTERPDLPEKKEE